MKNLKYILIFLLLVIISTAGYAGWDYYNTKKIEEIEGQRKVSDRLRYEQEVEPRDWNVYESEEYGFRIKYPKDWYLVNNNCFNSTGNYEDGCLVMYGIYTDTVIEKVVEEDKRYGFGNVFFSRVESIDEKENIEEVKIFSTDNSYKYLLEGDDFVFSIFAPYDYDQLVTEEVEMQIERQREVLDKIYKSFEFID